MDLRGLVEKRFGMPNSLGISFNNNPSSIGEPTSKISLNAGNGISVLSPPHCTTHVDHHHYQQQNRQDSPEEPPPQSQDPERDPDPVSIAVVTASIAPIATVGSNPRTLKTKINQASSVRYRECLKNHAASIGGHVVDGCGEFMPSGDDGTAEALKCAACDCHRNFHRKEAEGESQSHHRHGGIGNCFYCYNNPNSKSRSTRFPLHTLPPPPAPATIQQHQKFTLGLPTSPPSGPMMMAFGGGGATESSSEELNVFHSNAGGAATTTVGPPQFALSKKRIRTKFSQEQKDRMLEFAEKVGWRIQKQDELAVQQFCAEVGVKRQVLKVWMHNNKHTMKKRETMEITLS